MRLYTICEDNTGALALAKLDSTDDSKILPLCSKSQWFSEHIVELDKIHTKNQLADILTKGLWTLMGWQFERRTKM